MHKKKILSFLLSLSLIVSRIPSNLVFAANAGSDRTVYLHAQGEKPTATEEVSTIYYKETADIYFAVNDPNRGAYENGVHKEPQYDMNGYTVTIYFDPQYLDYASENGAPIDYTVPDSGMKDSSTGSENTGSGTVENVPNSVGYYVRTNKRGTENVNGKIYKSATITVFFSGGYVPQKEDDGTLWYNLCKLPLKAINTGSTKVFFDTSGKEGTSLELFAKNTSDDLNDQTFRYTAVNGGYHTLVIKDKSKPATPVATPNEGSYTEKQTVTLSAEDDCEIYYSLHGEEPQLYTDTKPIEIETTTTITCYAQRISDEKKKSNTVRFTYKIIPKAPFLFVEKDGGKELIPNHYNLKSIFKVYVSDKETYAALDADNEIYYTFSNLSEENITPGTQPETEWVKLNPMTREIEITKKTTVRLVTKKENELSKEYSEVAEYQLGISPEAPTADKVSGAYENKIDITLSSEIANAEIYYTLDGTDPTEETNGILYDGMITLAKDATLRAAVLYDGIYSEISSYWYVFTAKDDFGVDAFYYSGVYEGSVNVTLMANNPENGIKYSDDDGDTWKDYTETLVIDTDTVILAKAGKDNTWGEVHTFTYTIKPQPPAFRPETAQFTNASKVSVYCPESRNDNTERFSLFYTLDNSDPITSNTRIQADAAMDSVEIDITKYTVIKAVVLKDGKTYSTVVTHSYDIVNKKPTRPLVTLQVGNYTRKISDDKGFATEFVPVLSGTEIYYTVSYDGTFKADPIPNTAGTIPYDGQPIEVKGHTIIKAVAVNVFGIKSDVGIFEYIITPEAPVAAPSATISGNTLPVVPVSAVKGSTVKYEMNGITNKFLCEDGSFYINTQNGNAYKDRECTQILGDRNDTEPEPTATLKIWAEIDNVESLTNTYVYKLSGNTNTLAEPYADKATGEYEEIKVDNDNNLLHIKLYSLNTGDTIQYRINNSGEWLDYTGDAIKIKNDTVLQARSKKDGNYSSAVSYVYNFVPLAPIIKPPSGRYVLSNIPESRIEYDSRAPQDKIDKKVYSIFYRKNGGTQDLPYTMGYKPDIDETMSFKAYVKNAETGRVSKNTINYYIIENENAAFGSVYVANPYDGNRISASLLGTGEYAKGIKLLTQNKNATIHYFYSYMLKDEPDSITTNNLIYDNTPITVNPSMTEITITAWLEDENGKIEKSDFSHKIEFVHLGVPKTSLGSEKVEFPKNTKYTLINDYPNDENIFLYYTLDGSDPTLASNESRKIYGGEELTLSGAVTVKAVYMSIDGIYLDMVYGTIGEYKYTTPTVQYTGSGGGGGGKVVDNTRAYTKDIFGDEAPTHISYINGYPDGSVQPNGNITREEIASVLYRIVGHEYEKPFVATGDMFPDVDTSRWSARDIEYMAEKEIISGYPDGEFKPTKSLTRAEFSALICRFAKLEKTESENPFRDVSESHWAYEAILSLAESGLVDGYEDETFQPENEITRAEVMTVINKILGRNPSDAYVKSLKFNPYTDLAKDKWYYTAVMEATVTHDYYLDKNGVEEKWENWK